MSSWDILGGNSGDINDDASVEYVGVIEEEVSPVQEPRSPRQNVCRVAPTDQEFYPVYGNRAHRNGVVGAPNRDEEDLVSYVDIPHGKQLGLTSEAIERLQQTPMTSLNGQMSQRIEPGTYVMYGPNRAEQMSGMGAAGAAGATTSAGATGSSSGLLSDIMGAVGQIGGSITGAVAAGAQSRREADIERLRIETEAASAAEARQWAFQEAQLEQSVRLAEIEAGAEELAVLREQAEAAAALEAQVALAPTAIVTSGTSPVVWILVALLGVGSVGGIIWAVSKKD
ncbi:MAG: hypothetical protein ACYS7Y_10780 [Planctomycetota bacterium]|jgi:hypothetical protein